MSRIQELEDRLLQLQAELEKLKAKEEPKLPKYGQIVEATDYDEWPNYTYAFRQGINGDAAKWEHWRPLQTSATRIEWEGGDPPVSVGTLVAYETRGGGFGTYPISGERWQHTGGHLDIVGYWVLEQE